ncbi:lipopolysaccharide biosynthesis protein WzxC [Calothrix brevissima NIES-22]|nr:lipopolysaccharide biosynthesis protein WzxC [Calothrix brevissima NIES-22]
MKQNLFSNQIRRGVIGLFASNLITFLVIGLSYIVYSKSLIPAEFGLYSIGLGIATFGNLVLDGGLKNTIIKSPINLNNKEEGSLLFLMIGSSLLVNLIILIIGLIIYNYFPATIQDYNFLALFSSAYWLSYPWIAIPTASLERRLDYAKIAGIESFGTIIERSLPAIFILVFHTGIYSFIWAVVLGRLFRVIGINLFYKPYFCIPSWQEIKAIFYLLSEGGWLQIATCFSLLRDNLHILLVGTMFGKDWVGYYAWGLQICLIASQIFVQISARISIPMFAQASSFEQRWQWCLYQVKLLTIFTAPLLSVILLVIPSINQSLFQDKWTTAITFLPLLFLRMIPGLATTPIGSLLMVHQGGRKFAQATIIWTLVEIIGAALLLSLLGPTGLAWSYSLAVWPGLWILLIFTGEDSQKLGLEVNRIIFQRSSLLIAGILSVLLYFSHFILEVSLKDSYINLFLLIPIVLISYLSEKDIRKLLRLKI